VGIDTIKNDQVPGEKQQSYVVRGDSVKIEIGVPQSAAFQDG